jgi:hypothetical protein
MVLGASMLAHALPTPPQNSKDVNVVNTPNVSVTNTPSVNVTNTPSVNVATMPAVTGSVTVTNTPTVNVGNTPTVNVSNTSAQPVASVHIDEPGRIPYQSQVDKSGSCTGAGACFFEFGSVPAGHRVVIQHVSGIASFTAGTNAIWVQLNNGSGAPVSSFFAPQAPPTLFSAFDQSVQAYFDPAAFGGIIEVGVSFIGGTDPGAGSAEIITLSGYELDCNVAPCAPIAH